MLLAVSGLLLLSNLHLWTARRVCSTTLFELSCLAAFPDGHHNKFCGGPINVGFQMLSLSRALRGPANVLQMCPGLR